jgi:hypothetical protein
MAEDPEVGDESGGGGKRMIITYQCFAEGQEYERAALRSQTVREKICERCL